MEQYYKDFLLNGTNDRAFSSVLDKDIIGNINNFIFGENSGNRIRGIIKDYADEIVKNRVADVLSDEFGLDHVLDSFTRLGTYRFEFFTNANLKNNNRLFTISSMQSLVEINDYTDLIKNVAVVENEEMSAKDKFNRFNSLKTFRDLFKSMSGAVDTEDNHDWIGKKINNKDKDQNRIYTQRLQVDIPGETNCYICKIQMRVVMNYTRVVYNCYCVLRNDIDYSLQLLDKEYDLNALQENNKTIRSMYENSYRSAFIAPLVIDDILNINRETSDKFTYSISNALNKNKALIQNLDVQIKGVEEKLSGNFEYLGLRIHEHLNSAADIIVESTNRLYSLNKNLSLKELEIAAATIVAAAINYNVCERNIMYKALDTVVNVSANNLISTIKLCMQNMPLDSEYEELQERFVAFKESKKNEAISVSNNAINTLQMDMYKMLTQFKISFEDIIVKSMYADNSGLFFKTPKDQEDKMTMLIAAKSIILEKAEKVNEFNGKSLFKLEPSSRRLSNYISSSINNSLISDINRINNFINSDVKLRVDERIEKVISDIDNLTLEVALGSKKDNYNLPK